VTHPAADARIDTTAQHARIWLLLIVVAGAVLRFYNLGWGAPYYHFHIDEHLVLSGADTLSRSPADAAMSPKFFIYSPLPMYALIAVRWVFEALWRPLVLTVPADQVTFMVLARGISAAFGTATIPLVYLIARQVAGRRAGLFAAALMAAAVLHLRESHFFSVDILMVFFSVLTLWLLVRIAAPRAGTPADGITWKDVVAVGAAFGAALLCKYTAVFLGLVIAVAFLAAGGTFPRDLGSAVRKGARACASGTIAVAVFLIGNPLAVLYHTKFRQDIHDWVTAPLTGQSKPIWAAQFFDISPIPYWFTNILWWGLGPAFEIAGLAGTVWLVWRRDRRALVAAAFVVAYFLVAGRSIAPFARYGVPLVPALAIAAGVLAADMLARSRGLAARAIVAVLLGTTALYAAAYMHVFTAEDSRLAASNFMVRRVPAGARVLVEPSQNMVPFGSYRTETNFYRDYMLRGAHATRDDYYHLISLDTYVYLYDRRPSDEEKRAYIAARLAEADYIVMDDTFLQFYQHLPAADYAPVKEYYDALFAGRLGFEQMRTFKVYPELFGVQINDDAAELTFRLFDHPRVFIFRRVKK
jgi:hypothetical protein